MREQIEQLRQEIKDFSISDAPSLEQFRLVYLSKKGSIGVLFDAFKLVPAEEKKEIGALVNQLKQEAQSKWDAANETLEHQSQDKTLLTEDLTKPYQPDTLGSRHPLALVQKQIFQIFERIGFGLEDGPEIEDDWHNFSALNFPDNHPAREMQDTFFIRQKPDILLRTHTSSVQVRLMKQQKPPLRALMPGRVYRNEAISARAHCFFHQVEGLYIDKNVSFVDLKQTLLYFAKEMFGKDTKIRLRPSFFPFTEPSAELDITCNLCKGKGCNVCKYSGWVEIGGAGMVDPEVLKLSGIDPQEYSGFAFGMGVERITMLKYQIKDLRIFSENDVRFVKQFQGI